MRESDESEVLLSQALYRLLQDETIDKVSVTDIVKEAGVSRATFYRYYYDKYQLFNRIYDRALDRTLYRFNTDYTWREATGAIYEEIKAHLPYYQHAITSTDVNSFRNYIFRISRDFHLGVLARAGLDVGNWKVVKPMESYIYGNLEIMSAWIREGMVEPIPEMQDVLDMGIPGVYAPYFVPGQDSRTKSA